jgi:hypothetical protein
MTIVFPNKIEDAHPTTNSDVKTGSLNQRIVTELDSKGVTEAVFKFLVQINQQHATEATPLLGKMILLSSEYLCLETAIEEMLKELGGPLPQDTTSYKKDSHNESMYTKQSLSQKELSKMTSQTEIKKTDSPEKILERGLFDLVAQRERLSINMQRSSQKPPFFTVSEKKKETEMQKTSPTEKEREMQSIGKEVVSPLKRESLSFTSHQKDHQEQREGKGGGGGEGKDNPQQQQQGEQGDPNRKRKQQEEKIVKIERSASISDKGDKEADLASRVHTPSKEETSGDIFMRFMALMARILSQAQADAHALYKRIKERTDNIDTLTSFIAKLNQTKGKVDWSKDEQLKALVDKARALGVEITPGKYSWTEDEKRALKDNIQMRKDTLEKMTQLERTDMQRYMQEASQCHQARSSILKLLKEVMDVLIQNLRAH